MRLTRTAAAALAVILMTSTVACSSSSICSPSNQGSYSCAYGCPSSYLGDDYCDPECYNADCNWDCSDCELPSDYCAPGCPDSWVGDGYCDRECWNEVCNWDGGDCTAQSDQCSSGCPDSFIGDGVCEPVCNTAACNYDGGDCSSPAPTSDAEQVSCLEAPVTTMATTYTDSTNSFSISLPDGWAAWPVKNAFVFTTAIVAPSALPGSPLASIEVRRTWWDVQGFYEEQKRRSDMQAGYEFIYESEEEITLGGIPAIRHEYITSGENPSHHVDYVVVYGRTALAIGFTTASECWSALEVTFETMANSFQVLD